MSAKTSSLEPPRRPRWLLAAVVAAQLGYVLYRNLDATPYDDGYFFKRFARNFLEHGSFSWNVADGPVHGLTSQLFQLAAVGILALAPTYFVFFSKVFLAGCLAATAWLFSGLVLRITGRFEVAAALTLLVVGNPLVTWTMHTGMEMAVTLLGITLALRASTAQKAARRRAVEAALLSVVVYSCRPDAAIIPVLAFLVANFRNKQSLVVFGVTFALALGACLIAFRLYYGTALPLPFYWKTLWLSRYDDALHRLGTHDKLVHLTTFAVFALPLVWLFVRGNDRRGLAFAAAALAFVAYHASLTTEIMGYRSRFYVPALIPLGLAAAFGSERALALPRSERAFFLVPWFLVATLAYFFGVTASASSSPLERLGYPAYLAHALLAGWLFFAGDEREGPALAGLFALFLLGSLTALPPRRSALLTDREFLAKSSAEVTTTRGIFDVERCLPRLRTLYHSEIGVPGLVLPDARIVDLAGLMSPSLTFERPSFDYYCARDRPEALFLPHKNYVGLNREIRASSCLRGYTQMVRHSSSPLYVRNDLAGDFTRCARDIQKWQ